MLYFGKYPRQSRYARSAKGRAANRRNYALTKDKRQISARKSQRKARKILRATVLRHYCNGSPPKCMCTCGCTVSISEILELDHLNNDGNQFRKNREGLMQYRWFIENNYPPVIRVVCPNCHKCRHRNVACPKVYSPLS